MEKLMPSQLAYCDFDLKNITVSKHSFPDDRPISYPSGREKDLVHFILSGTREYTFEGETFTVSAGTALFIPDGTVYSTRSFESCTGIGICFECGIPLVPGIHRRWNDLSRIPDLFEKMNELYLFEPASLLKLKFTLMRLISHLISDSGDAPAALRPALIYIAEHFTENQPISVYANECNMSESYFRRKFSSVMGRSPITYRNELRFKEAERLYRQGMTLQAIAEKLGFYDAGCLCKQYKKHTGGSLKRSLEVV